MRIAAVFMGESMPCRPRRVKVPESVSIILLHRRMNRVRGKCVRALFIQPRDYTSRVQPKRSSMRRAYTMLGLGTAVFFAAASLTLLPNGTQASSTEKTFMVPAADGYGVAECLISSQACGQVVADTWCEAQGYARAAYFKQVTPNEMAGSVQKVSVESNELLPVAITCTN